MYLLMSYSLQWLQWMRRRFSGERFAIVSGAFASGILGPANVAS